MKRNCFSFFVLSFGCLLYANAQEPDVALAIARYELVHVNDTADRENPRKEELVLYMGQHASVYQSHTLVLRQQEMEEKLKGLATGGATAAVRNVSVRGVTNEKLFYFRETNSLQLVDQIGQAAYIVDLGNPAIDWELTGEEKEISGYLAQQATGRFGGRDYTVWFASELPFPYGPWKLHGLPGLILEAYDSKHEVVFNFIGFSKDAGEPIALPEDAAKASPRDFARAKEAFQNNPTVAISGSAPAGAARQVMMVKMDDNGNRTTYSGEEAEDMMRRGREQARLKNNNPMELDAN